MSAKCWAVTLLALTSFVNVIYYIIEGSAKGMLLASAPCILAALWVQAIRYENG